MVMRCADAGDAIAKRIVIDAAHLLAQNICAMSHAVGLEDTAFDVVLAGGVATGAGPLFQSTITQAVHALFPLAHILVLRRQPVVGALLLAMDAVGCQVQLNLREW
jgi:N-acetylglucosamine kinase-like BadF-type ATPase